MEDGTVQGHTGHLSLCTAAAVPTDLDTHTHTEKSWVKEIWHTCYIWHGLYVPLRQAESASVKCNLLLSITLAALPAQSETTVGNDSQMGTAHWQILLWESASVEEQLPPVRVQILRLLSFFLRYSSTYLVKAQIQLREVARTQYYLSTNFDF